MSNFWDERFGGDEYVYGVEPNQFLREEAHRIPSGPVLSLGEGEGRNAVFLAGCGHMVVAVDFSRAGLKKTERLAKARGVSVTTVHADLTDYEPPVGEFAGVISIFAHTPPEVRAKLHARAARALVPGGCLILEAYRPEQLAFDTGGPRDPRLLVTLAALREELHDLTLEVAREVEREVYEGRFHDGRSATVQVVARRRP